MLSIIVPAHNEQQYIHKCLDAIMSQKTSFQYEVIVVNNASTDNTKDVALSFGTNVIDVPKKGLSLAKNSGAKSSMYDHLLFVDADCIIPSNHVQTVCETFIANPQIAAFGGPYIYKDGGKIVQYITLDLKYFYRFSSFMGKVFGVPIISGGDFAIRKNVFLALGGFNELFSSPIEAEDLEFCKRLARRGYTVRMLPGLYVESSFRRQLKLSAPIHSLYRLHFTLKHLHSK